MSALMVVFVLLEAWTLLLAIRSEQVPDVLDLPEVSVDSRTPGTDEPALSYPAQSAVTLSGEWCNTSEDEVGVTHTLQWATAEPRSTVLTESLGIDSLSPGCRTFATSYPVPDLVVQRTRELTTAFPTLDCVQWILTGVLAPAPGVGQPDRWVSEPFCIYVDKVSG
jgi:hypothetical protein